MMEPDRHSHGRVPTLPRTGCTCADCAAAHNPHFVLPVATLAVLPRVLAAVEHLPIANDSAPPPSRGAAAGAARRGRAPGSTGPDLEERTWLGRPGSRGVHPARPVRPEPDLTKPR